MNKRRIIRSVSSLAVCVLIGLTLYFGESVSDSAVAGLRYASTAVIPALFSFSVLARLLSSSGFDESVYRALPLHRLLGLPECAAPVVLCGLVGGFPIGAILTCDLYERGKLTRGEAARLCAISSNVSPAFLISVVGELFSSRVFGLVLWISQSLLSLASGVLLRSLPDDCHRLTQRGTGDGKQSPVSLLCDAVSSSAMSCLYVTGYIVFFCTLSALLSEIFPILTGFFALTMEFASGVKYAAATNSFAACGFAVGFGGISALMQITDRTSECGIPVIYTVVLKSLSSAVLAGVGYAFAAFFA